MITDAEVRRLARSERVEPRIVELDHALGWALRGIVRDEPPPLSQLCEAGAPPLSFAIHRELEELVGAGLSPFEALQSATVNPARFLGRGPGAGMVAEGSPAGLLLLEGDPLAAIQYTHRIVGVVRRGEWLDRATLDSMLADRG